VLPLSKREKPRERFNDVDSEVKASHLRILDLKTVSFPWSMYARDALVSLLTLFGLA
jgi:hypothetical protein